MQQDNQQTYPYQTDEIDLGKLVKRLAEYRWGIFGFTGIVTLVATIYVLLLPPSPYLVTTSFLSPNQSSVMSLNRFPLTNETSESIFTSYLKKLSSINLQRKIFFENDYLAALNPKNEPIDDVEGYFLSFINSISIQAPVTKQTKDETVGNLLEKPYSISLQGINDEIISSFLNELTASANSETVNDLISIIKQKIDIRLDEISKEHGLLLTGAQRDRLSQIERIKEEDGQKIREINDQIDSLRLKALRDRLSQIERIKEEDGQKIREINDQIDALRYRAQQVRLNQITILSKAAKLAGSLGIIENNLKQISESESNFNLNIAINDDEDDLPEWYLYGEKALLERVELLESRTSDDPFIPELVTLTNQLKAVQNNNVLKTLEERQDDSPFIARINELDIERINLESFDPIPSGIDAMQLTQSAYSEKIPNKNILIIAVALIGGFMFSIFLALLTNLFKEDETEPTTKTSR